MTEQVKQMLDDLGDWRGTRALYIRELCYPAPQLTRVGNGTDPPPRQAN
jgi:hypothetical protein